MVVDNSTVCKANFMAISRLTVFPFLEPNWRVILTVLSITVDYIPVDVCVVHYTFNHFSIGMSSALSSLRMSWRESSR
jgi:hypothetical protein